MNPGRRAERIVALDVARGIAVLMMFVAHVAPSDGPMRILLTTEFLTAPLFALLVGSGAQLSAAGQGSGLIRPSVVRALMLVVLGWLLALSSAQVVIVLVHLGVLALLCIPLSRCRTSVLAAWALFAGLTAVALPLIAGALGSGADVLSTGMDGLALRVVAALGGAGPYRLAAFVLYAVVGMLLMRWLADRDRWRPAGGAGIAALFLMAGLLIAPNLLGLFGVHAYDGTPAETFGNLAGAAGILLLCWALTNGRPGRSLPAAVWDALAAPGRMALTLYTLQVLILHAYTVLSGGSRDDHWWMLALLIGASLGFTVLWRTVCAVPAVDRHLSPAMRRGPLEGVIGLVADLGARPRRARAARP